MKNNFYKLCAASLMLIATGAKGQIITTVVGTGTNGYLGDGLAATTAHLNYPGKAVMDASGNLYIADKANQRIRKVDPTGIITTIGGNGSAGLGGDGTAATAAILNNPVSVCLDASGNIFIADFANSRVRKISTSGIMTTVAGTTAGLGGDGGAATAAAINNPTDVAVDPSGNLYICDYGNHRIRMVNTSGIISTFAGSSAGYTGDGGAATDAKLYSPNGVCSDHAGNIFIADLGNSVVRKVDAAGIISTYAGTTAGFSGDGGAATAAQINNPSFVTSDIAGNIFISDMGNQRVRRASTDGLIYTIAGTGTGGWTGDGGPATAADLGSPTGLAFDANNNLYVTSQPNGVVRKVSVATLPITGSDTVCISDTTTISGIVPCGIWSSSNTSVATVNAATGLVTGIAAGTATISYNMGIASGTHVVTTVSCPLNVQQAAVRAAAIFPNPSDGHFTVQLPNNAAATTLTVLDMMGKVVATYDAGFAKQLTMDLSYVLPGNYLLKMCSGDKTYHTSITIGR